MAIFDRTRDDGQDGVEGASMTRTTERRGRAQVSVVVATNHDSATRRLLPAAKETARVLVSAGHKVHEFCGPRARCSLIYVALMEMLRRGRHVVLGFLAAHGDDKGLYGADGKIIIDVTLCKQLDRAILILASCLEHGEFAGTVTKGGDSVRACIGFKDQLWVFSPGWRDWVMMPWLLKKVAKEHCNCLVEPVHALLGGKSVKGATESARCRWNVLAAELAVEDPRIGLVFEVNANNQTYWGDAKARL